MSIYLPDGYSKIRECTCGRQNWTERLVPNSIIGVDIRPACCVHDWMYTYPEDAGLDWKDKADIVFLANMRSLIEDAGGSRILKGLRRSIAWTYYIAVKNFGGASFRKGKKPKNILPIEARKADYSEVS